MPTVITHTLKKDGSGDYTTINAYLTAVKRNLVSADEVARLEIHGAGWDSATPLNEDFVSFTGFTTDATRRVELVAVEADRHNFTPGTGFCWTASATFGFVFWGLDALLDGFELDNPSHSNELFYQSEKAVLQNCLVHDTDDKSEFLGAASNCIFWNPGNLAPVRLGSAISSTIIIRAGQGTFGAVAVNTGTVNDVVVYKEQARNDWNAYHSTSGDYNAVNRASEGVPGANSLENLATTDFVDYANHDYRIKTLSSFATAGSGGGFMGAALEAGGGSGVSVEIPTLDNAATTYAPVVSVSDHQSVEIPTSLHVITTYAPSVSIGDNVEVEIPSLDNSATTYAPIVSTTSNTVVTIPTSLHSITLYAPVVSVTNHVSVEIPTSLHKITTYAPTVATVETPDLELNLSSTIVVTENLISQITDQPGLTAPIKVETISLRSWIRTQKPVSSIMIQGGLTLYGNMQSEINLIATMRG